MPRERTHKREGVPGRQAPGGGGELVPHFEVGLAGREFDELRGDGG